MTEDGYSARWKTVHLSGSSSARMCVCGAWCRGGCSWLQQSWPGARQARFHVVRGRADGSLLLAL